MTVSKNPERLEKIKELAKQGHHLNSIASELGICHQVVLYYEKKHGLDIPRARDGFYRSWADEEIDYLIYATEDHSIKYKDIAQHLGRTVKSVTEKVRDLKKQGILPDKTGRQWSDKDVGYLFRMYNKIPITELAEQLERSPRSIENKAGKLGLRKSIDRNLKEKIQALAGEGLYLNEIAKKLHIGHNLVIYYENTYGFKVPREPEDLRKERCKKTIRDFWNRFPVHYTGRY